MNLYRCGRRTSIALFSVLSAVAFFNPPAVSAQTNCITPPGGQVSWWRAEGDGLDAVDSNTGILYNSVAFAPGMVGQTFNFNGAGAHVRVVDKPNLHATNALTLEAWINPAGGGDRAIFGKWDVPGGLNQKSFSFSLTSDGRCYLLLSGNGTDSPSGQAITPNAIPGGQWSHVAGVYDGASIRIYVNGTLQAQTAYSQGIFPGTDDMAIGGVVGGTVAGQVSAPFNGMIDEAGFYARALTAPEILGIYNAGSAGKCRTNFVLPSITGQPKDAAVIVGSNATFSATASGSDPLTYQWTFNGTNIAGATTTFLTVTNAQLTDAGNYALRVSNNFGFAVSTNALLTVIPVATNCVPLPTGIVSLWPGEGSGVDVINTNSGVLLNGVGFVSGVVGKAFSFDGSGAHVRIADRPSLHATNALTLEAWIKPAAFDGERAIMGKWDNPAGLNQKTFSFSLTGDGRCYLLVSGNGTDNVSGQAFSSNSVVAGQWSHVAGVYDGTSVRVYINGVLRGQTAYSSGIFPGTDDLAIGGVVGGSPVGQVSVPFNGQIDEPTFYARALSQTELLTIYSAGIAGGVGKCHPGLPPIMLGQPQSLTVYAGSTATFTGSAAGSDPLSYQWTFNGSNIFGATTTSLSLTNVQLANAGNYNLVVTNSFGIAGSSNAVLTVFLNPSNCVAPTAGLVSWWPGEGSAQDISDGNAGTIYGGVTFANGEVAQAFALDGISGHIRISDRANLHFTTAMTVESWINPAAINREQAILGKWDNYFGLNQKTFSFSVKPDGRPYLLLSGNGDDGVSAQALSSTNIPAGQWSHVVGTYDGTNIQIYVNGKLQGQAPFSSGIFPGTNDIAIGGVVGGSPTGEVTAPFLGKIDEVSLYNRALSGSEILAIYNAGVFGKCHAGLAPSITLQPQSQSVLAGTATTFTVGAAGTPPLSYQWLFNGGTIQSATSSSLTLSNVQPSNAGNYSVRVTNAFGSITSSIAALTVSLPTPIVKVSDVTNVTAGGSFTVPITLAANGNENAVSFTLNFDSSKLIYVSTAQGSDAGSATFFLNETGSSTGRVGIALALPIGATFPAGSREVARVTFNVAIVTSATQAGIDFVDQPIARQLSDANGVALPVTFQAGNASIAAVQFEGDVSPRTNGNQAVTVTDWVTIGLFAAGLQQPSSAAEFQRADCAPRSSLGNGHITTTDWVQAGRYVAGLDPLTPAGGPTGPFSANTPLMRTPQGPYGPSTRQVLLSNAALTAGQSGTVIVSLHGQGNEMALGFSLGFDPANVIFENASLANGVTGVTLNVNSLNAPLGQLGFLLSLSGTNTFSAGDHSLVQVAFRTAPSAGGAYPIGFGDGPVFREISDADANALAADYVSASLTVSPLPPLSISQSGREMTLSWPSWATGFKLQSADSVSATWTDVDATVTSANGQNSVTLTISGPSKLYRLHQ